MNLKLYMQIICLVCKLFIKNSNGFDQSNKSNAFEVYNDGHAEVQTQGETNNSVVTKRYVDGIEERFTANIIYDRITNTTPQITTYTYIQKGDVIEARGSVNIDISNIEDKGYAVRIQLPKEAKYRGLALGNVQLQLGDGTGYWYQFIGSPFIDYDNNYITINLSGLHDSYCSIAFSPYFIKRLLKSANIENFDTVAETISKIIIDFAISYTVNE